MTDFIFLILTTNSESDVDSGASSTNFIKEV
jgi:hypothetical protein